MYRCMKLMNRFVTVWLRHWETEPRKLHWEFSFPLCRQPIAVWVNSKNFTAKGNSDFTCCECE